MIVCGPLFVIMLDHNQEEMGNLAIYIVTGAVLLTACIEAGASLLSVIGSLCRKTKKEKVIPIKQQEEEIETAPEEEEEQKSLKIKPGKGHTDKKIFLD